MPGYDGTGPRGCGPMTGGGSGYCLLKMPRTLDESQTGFAGLSGTPVALLPGSPRVGIASLHVRVQRIQLALRGMDRRLAILEAVRHGIGDPRCNADDEDRQDG